MQTLDALHHAGRCQSMRALDQSHDDRRMRLECQHLQRKGDCFAAPKARIPGADRGHHPVVDALFRCDAFKWQVPV